MNALRRSICFLFFAVMLGAGCEHADPLDPNRLEPTLSSIQANVFDLNCALSGCHGLPNPQAGMNLSNGQAFANTVNVRSVQNAALLRIAPGDPDNSYLVWKIEGRSGIGGSRMPRGRAPLPQEQIDVIRQWIADGAQNN